MRPYTVRAGLHMAVWEVQEGEAGISDGSKDHLHPSFKDITSTVNGLSLEGLSWAITAALIKRT